MYIALRSFKVKGFDGEYHFVKFGDDVPEAKTWKNRRAYVDRRWICLKKDMDEETRLRYAAVKKATKAAKTEEKRSGGFMSSPSSEEGSVVSEVVDNSDAETEPGA